MSHSPGSEAADKPGFAHKEDSSLRSSENVEAAHKFDPAFERATVCVFPSLPSVVQATARPFCPRLD